MTLSSRVVNSGSAPRTVAIASAGLSSSTIVPAAVTAARACSAFAGVPVLAGGWIGGADGALGAVGTTGGALVEAAGA
ncbi:MAG: hypothetical protein M3Y30_16470, partial [Gemmatimonadota bacterium]|nr:hypothetical protein [Gemmatimonadota bacterium]